MSETQPPAAEARADEDFLNEAIFLAELSGCLDVISQAVKIMRGVLETTDQGVAKRALGKLTPETRQQIVDVFGANHSRLIE